MEATPSSSSASRREEAIRSVLSFCTCDAPLDLQLNQDYREAERFMPPDSIPTLELHAHGTGSFAEEDVRLKKHYVRHARG